jgi:hypothetical protein
VNVYRSVLLRAGVLFFSAIIGCAGAPSCKALEQSTSAELVSFLEGDRAGLQTECINFAITSLGDRYYGPATDVLISYLDFKVVWPKGVPYELDHLVWKPEYPAAQALLNIGVPATGNLIRAVGNTGSSDLLRTNAEEVLLMVYRHNPPRAIALLRAISKSAPDVVSAARLFESAIEVSRMCGLDEIRAACDAALN